MSFKVNEDEALELEELEARELARRRTEKAIAQTYKSEFSSKSEVPGRGRSRLTPFTKARRKLPNGRTWKNKDAMHSELRGKMIAGRFNDSQRRDVILKGIYKRNAKNNSIADAMVRGDDPL